MGRQKVGRAYPVVFTVKLTLAQAQFVERKKGHLSRSEYLRALVQRDMGMR